MMLHSNAHLRASFRCVCLAGLVSLGATSVVSAAGLTVAWNPNSEGNLSAYVVSYATASGAQTQTVTVSVPRNK